MSRNDKPYFVATFDGECVDGAFHNIREGAYGSQTDPTHRRFVNSRARGVATRERCKILPHPSGVKTAMSRCIEVIYHSRYRLLAYYLLRRLHAPQYLIATAAVGASYSAPRLYYLGKVRRRT